MQRSIHLLISPLLLALFASALLFAPLATLAQAPAETAPPVITPTLQVPIPGLNFEGSVIVTGPTEGTENCAANHTCVYTIERYINAILKYGIGAGVIFCIVLIMIGGIEWMVGSAVGGIARAQKRIKNATMGLVLLLGITTILLFINPAITALNSLSIENVKRKIPDPPREAIVGNVAIDTTAQNEAGEAVNIVSVSLLADQTRHPNIEVGTASTSAEMVHKDMVEPLHRVANALHDATGKKMLVLAGFADPKQTARRFYEKCVLDRCTDAVCNPLDGTGVVEGNYDDGFRLSSGFQQEIQQNNLNEDAILELLGFEAATNQTRKCPYESGYAVAVLCENEETTRVSDLACQTTLETLMKQEGFCRSYYQPWHYEQKGKQTSVTLCNWKPGTMRRPTAICGNSDVQTEYTTGGQTSTCAVNYANRADTCSRWNMETGQCESLNTSGDVYDASF